MRIAVCDDDGAARDELSRLIGAQRPNADISVFASAGELLASRGSFELIFLDVAMEGLDGIALARELRRAQEDRGLPRAVIIFVSGYREYMEDAFDVNAFHYLVKPVEPAKFRSVFERAWREAAALAEGAGRHILIRSAGVCKKVPLADIFYIESSNKKSVIHTRRGRTEVYIKLEDLERELAPSFYRCHRCCLVNLEKISAYGADMVELTSGERLPLSKKKYPDFVKAYLRYAKEGGVVNVR